MSLSLQAAKAGGSAYRRGVNAGDPGIFGAIGGALKTVGGAALGIAAGVGLPGAGAAQGLIKTISAAKQGSSVGMAIPNFTGGPAPAAPSKQSGGGSDFVARGVFGDRATFSRGGRVFTETRAVAGCPKGYHPNKSAYYRKVEGKTVFIPKGHVCVKNRSRNPLNARALRKAVGRIDAAKTWQSKLHEIETGKYTKAGNRKS